MIGKWKIVKMLLGQIARQIAAMCSGRRSLLENSVMRAFRQLQKIPEVRSLRRKPGGEELKKAI